ncbi:sodium/hydrogen exchanger [Arthrobacter sp. StoSoilB3]|nr:sodium/hydrogen exchanger [Arthrobacter sp. StoSoilB3]
MAITIALLGLASLIWSLVHRKMKAIWINGPMIMVAMGAVIGWFTTKDSAEFFDSNLALYLAEITLALLLFVDAVDVRGSVRAQFGTVPLRLLFIALPLSVALVIALGLALPLGLSTAAVLAIACISVPADFSPELSILKDKRVPNQVRRWLSVESGYNDGLVSPLLLGALALAASSKSAETDAFSALLKAAPAGLLAILVGAALGTMAGRIFRTALRSGWADQQSIRIGIVAIPITTFGLAVLMGANGFVAAFVCGIAFRIARGKQWEDHVELSFVEDLTSFVNLLLWLAFGVAAVTLISATYDWWPALILAFFALTLGRFIPVWLSLTGSRVRPKDKLFMAAMGPRGAASIVFGLLAFNALPEEQGFLVLAATTMVVLGSLILHGASGTILITKLYGKRTPQPVRQ